AAWQDRMRERLGGARHVIRRLEEEGRLAAEWSAGEAADYLFTTLSLATYQSLVVELRWSKARYIEHLGEVLAATLVKPTPAGAASRARSPARPRRSRRRVPPRRSRRRPRGRR